MEELKRSLISQARRKYKNIYPCGSKRSLYDCFTTEGGELSFWFNTADQSTRLIACKVTA
jgi:hypothetical protein